MDRLADYANSNNTNMENNNIDIFALFKKNIDMIIQMSTDDSLDSFKKLLDLQAAFLKFTLNCYPDNTNYVNNVLESCVSICSKVDRSQFDENCFKNIVKFLTYPLETMSTTILSMNQYPKLMDYL